MLLLVALALAALVLIAVELARAKTPPVRHLDPMLTHRASEELIQQVEAWRTGTTKNTSATEHRPPIRLRNGPGQG